jgi:hypothetical protein
MSAHPGSTQKHPQPIDKNIGESRGWDILSIIMRKRKSALSAAPIKDETRTWYTFERPAGEIVHNTRYFFAWKDGHLVGTFGTLKEAMDSLVWRRGELNPQ